MSDDRIRTLHDMIPADWDQKPLALAHEIGAFLTSVKDEGTNIDRGTSDGSADLWVTVQGVEYYVNIKKSNAQLAKEGRLPPPSNFAAGT